MSKQFKNYKGDLCMSAAEEYMYKGMLAKFTQNDSLKRTLLETGENLICEANPNDKVWGVGLSLANNEVFIEDKWKGRNLAGCLLQRVRELLK